MISTEIIALMWFDRESITRNYGNKYEECNYRQIFLAFASLSVSSLIKPRFKGTHTRSKEDLIRDNYMRRLLLLLSSRLSDFPRIGKLIFNSNSVLHDSSVRAFIYEMHSP